MNIAMEDTEEFVDGALKSAYGDAFIRGNNGTHNFYLWHTVLYITSLDA